MEVVLKIFLLRELSSLVRDDEEHISSVGYFGLT